MVLIFSYIQGSLGPGSWVCVGSIGGTWGWLFIFVIVDVLMCTSLPG